MLKQKCLQSEISDKFLFKKYLSWQLVVTYLFFKYKNRFKRLKDIYIGSWQKQIYDNFVLGVVLYAMLNGSLPFRTDSFRALQSVHLDKDYRFRREVLMRTSVQAVKLVDQMLEPNWLKRITVIDAFKSSWMAMDSKLTLLTPMEESALANIADFTMKKRIKIKQETDN